MEKKAKQGRREEQIKSAVESGMRWAKIMKTYRTNPAGIYRILGKRAKRRSDARRATPENLKTWLEPGIVDKASAALSGEPSAYFVEASDEGRSFKTLDEALHFYEGRLIAGRPARIWKRVEVEVRATVKP